MSAVLQRLNMQKIRQEAVDNPSREWIFSKRLAALAAADVRFIRPLVRNHLLIKLEYEVQCSRLLHDLKRKSQDENYLNEQIASTLMLAELLELIYRDYLNVPREIHSLHKEQDVLKKLLQNVYIFDCDALAIESPYAISKQVRDTTANLNWLRLFTFRARRLLLAISPLMHELSPYRHWLGQLDQYVSPILAYVAWVFFAPRLADNLLMTAKHLIPGYWMSDKAYQLGWFTRLMAEGNRRWVDLANDAAWLAAGLLNCFVLIGALAPVGIYFVVLMQAFDVALASVRLIVEMYRLDALYKEYQKLSQALPELNDEICDHQRHLAQRMAYEKKRLMIGVINTSVILFAILFAIPAVSIHPVIPVIGAAIAVLTTILCYIVTKQLEASKPNSNIKSLEDKVHSQKIHTFFSSQRPKNDSVPVFSENHLKPG